MITLKKVKTCNGCKALSERTDSRRFGGESWRCALAFRPTPTWDGLAPQKGECPKPRSLKELNEIKDVLSNTR